MKFKNINNQVIIIVCLIIITIVIGLGTVIGLVYFKDFISNPHQRYFISSEDKMLELLSPDSRRKVMIITKLYDQTYSYGISRSDFTTIHPEQDMKTIEKNLLKNREVLNERQKNGIKRKMKLLKKMKTVLTNKDEYHIWFNHTIRIYYY